MSDTSKALNAVVICGPSGVGKGTLLKRLFGQFPDRFAYSVSHTTRAPRPGEENGREYHFVSREEILEMQEADEFLELCDVHGNFYGTSVRAVSAVQTQGKTCVIEIDVKGAQKLAARSSNAKAATPVTEKDGDIVVAANDNKSGEGTTLNPAFFFITAPLEELRNRIIGRGCEGEECVQRRLATAETEYAFLKENPTFFSAVIVNDELDAAYERLVQALNAVFARHHMKQLE